MLVPAGNNVDPSAQLGRTREAIVGIQHELISNLAVGVDYIYRKYDKGTATYTQGYQPGAPGFPLSQIYSGPLTFTDPVTGQSAPYYEICQGCQRPSGVGSIVMTESRLRDLPWRRYHGDQALQQPVADADGADAPDQSELPAGRVGERSSIRPRGHSVTA